MYVVKERGIFDDLIKNVNEISGRLTSILHISCSYPLEEIETKLRELRDETQVLRTNINGVNELHLPKVQKGKVIEDLQSELKNSQTSLSKILKDAKKYSAENHASKLDSMLLHRQIAKQEELTASLQLQLMQESKQNINLHEQLFQERSMCTSMGATLACMLWRACRDSNVATSMLTWYKFPEFLRIATGTLESFISTYVTENSEVSIPSAGSDEGQYVAGMVGTVTNMLASPPGRESLIASEDGQQLLLSMTDGLSHIPAKQGDYLRRLILMALYNVVIDKLGLHFLWKQGVFPKAIVKNILHINDECRLLSLRILAIFTNSPPSWQTTAVALKDIPVEDLRRISIQYTGEDNKLAIEILQNLQI